MAFDLDDTGSDRIVINLINKSLTSCYEEDILDSSDAQNIDDECRDALNEIGGDIVSVVKNRLSQRSKILEINNHNPSNGTTDCNLAARNKESTLKISKLELEDARNKAKIQRSRNNEK